MNREAYILEVVKWLKKRGFEEIRANVEGYETPIGYALQSDEEKYIPDVTGRLFSENSYFEVVLKTDKVSRTISKLRLLSTLAAAKGGKLFLMTPRGHFNFAKDIALQHQIHAEVIKIV
ncbi:hypothetical protein [Runella sp.]|jgi:hypothetical protein|uniref:hypothetical protein n=1 Tax=Runella sp. TaxID=1960881 RepID=UPI002602ABC3|nr:hypothetical protein [Runella sp.]